jgi:hypothetical protein
MLAMEFLRKHLRRSLALLRGNSGPYDHVLQENERKPDAIPLPPFIISSKIQFVPDWWRRSGDYLFLGCCVAGYPDLDVRQVDYWELFWRIYNRLVSHEPAYPVATSVSEWIRLALPLAHARGYKNVHPHACYNPLR